MDEAIHIFEQQFHAKPGEVEQISLSQAHQRVLAKDVKAPLNVPPFNRATVDGYAVHAADTFGADEKQPVTLKLLGCVTIDEMPEIILNEGTTVGIVTGAPIPSGADAVVMMEYTIQKNKLVSIYRPVSQRENVMEAGSDIRKGETMIRRDQLLSSRDIGVFAALGFTKVDVYKRPRVAVLSTGAEIVEPGKSLVPGKIYDINAYTISAAVQECGGQPSNFGIVPDEIDELRAVLKKALASADIIITSGGVSVGPKDVVPKVLNMLGKPGVIVSGIAIKPGKPTTIAIVNKKPIFSLPGHPTSSLLIFHVFVRPIILKMAGRQQEPPFIVKATAAEKMFQAKGRRTFVMVDLIQDESGKLLARPVALGLSGAITTLSKAEGFVIIPERWQFINAGDDVTVHLFKPLPEFALSAK
ncbi:MAG: molybdopterin-binding protein [Candidatus Bathyarchaeota archaeon]|nr:molybdopterin-binding protein [Candidatus Bathyarchaeota archaeon]